MSDTTDRERRSLRDALDRYRVTTGDGFALDDHASDDLPEGLPDKAGSRDLLAALIEEIAALQERLYANSSWSLLVIVQAMDAAGKDSTIKHVMSGVNPQGVRVTSFKAPGPEELAHDFLWRAVRALPRRGEIGIFNRSHYEDILVTRVHPEMVAEGGLPAALADAPDLWETRIADIAAFEAYLGRQGTRVVKVFLDVGRDEQKARFLSRLDEPDKEWKFSAADLRERARWDDYRDAYRAAIAGTATPDAPWYVVPADRKWLMRLLVAEAIVSALESLDLEAPKPSAAMRREIDAARRDLERDTTSNSRETEPAR